jgi:type VI secretion system protein
LRAFLRQESTGPSRFIRLISLLCLIAALNGCAKRQLTVKIAIVAEANGNNPIAVDVVRVANKDLAKEISKLTAADWFQKRDQYLRDYAKPGVLSVDSQEWVPGQPVPALKLPEPLSLPIPMISKTPTMLVFANYFSPGPHRATLQPNKIITIQLGADDLSVVVDKK